MQTKGKWEKPTLVILGRGRPEERVLLNCKTMTIATGKNHANNSCVYMLCQQDDCQDMHGS